MSSLTNTHSEPLNLFGAMTLTIASLQAPIRLVRQLCNLNVRLVVGTHNPVTLERELLQGSTFSSFRQGPCVVCFFQSGSGTGSAIPVPSLTFSPIVI